MRYITFLTAILAFLSFDCNGQGRERDTIFFALKKGELFLNTTEYPNGAREQRILHKMDTLSKVVSNFAFEILGYHENLKPRKINDINKYIRSFGYYGYDPKQKVEIFHDQDLHFHFYRSFKVFLVDDNKFIEVKSTILVFE